MSTLHTIPNFKMVFKWFGFTQAIPFQNVGLGFLMSPLELHRLLQDMQQKVFLKHYLCKDVLTKLLAIMHVKHGDLER